MAVIRRRENGKWQAIIRRKGHPPQRQTFRSKHDARRWATEIENEIDRGVFVDRTPSESATIGKLIDRYIDEIAPQKKSAANMSRCLPALKVPFGHYALAALQPRHVAAYRDERLSAGRAGATIVKEMKSLSLVIDAAAKDWGYPIAMNPVRAVRMPAAAPGRNRRLTGTGGDCPAVCVR